MAGSTGKTHDGMERRRVRQTVLAVLVVVAVGLLAGAGFGDGDMDASRWLFLAVGFVLLAAGVVAGHRWRNRRWAARFGMSPGRFSRVVRMVQRGVPPDDPAERAAAVDVAARMRRAQDSSSAGWAEWLIGGGALLWFVAAVFLAIDGRYGQASYNLVMTGLLLVSLLTIRRRRRRLDAAERALGIRTSA